MIRVRTLAFVRYRSGMPLSALLLRILLVVALATNAFGSLVHAHDSINTHQQWATVSASCHHHRHAAAGVHAMDAMPQMASHNYVRHTDLQSAITHPAHDDCKCCGGGTCHCLSAHSPTALMVAYLHMFIPIVPADIPMADAGALLHLSRVPLLRPPIA